MTRGRQPTETEELDSGLSTIEDPYQINDLLTRDVDELANEFNREILYSVVAMVKAGRLAMAIKTKLPHGEWEDFMAAHQWSFDYVRGCLKILEVVSKYPQAVHLPPGRATQRLLHSPLSRIDAVLAELPEKALKNLTPWDIHLAYAKHKLAEGKTWVGKDHGPVEPPSELHKLYAKATSILRLIADLKISRGEFDDSRVFAHKLDREWQHASYNLFDPGHKKTPPWELDPMHDDITPEEDAED